MKPDVEEKACAKAKALGEALHRGRLILSDPNLKEHYDEWIDMIDIKNAEDRIREYEANEARYAERYWNKY
jgi:KaiC/GvpD/RAD55 family RecA-like ATPase